MYNFTKNDFLILRSIYKRKGFTEMISVSIKTLQEDTSLSSVKIRQTLSMFIEIGYVKQGLNKTNAKTYYITQEGIDKLKELLGGIDNV